MRRVLHVKVVPGDPLNGTGRACIHLFVRDARGPFVEPHVLHPAPDGERRLVARPTRGRLACDPRRKVAPVTRGGVTTLTMRTDDPRAVTCPKCAASRDWRDLMDQLEKRGEPLPQDS